MTHFTTGVRTTFVDVDGLRIRVFREGGDQTGPPFVPWQAKDPTILPSPLCGSIPIHGEYE